MDLVRVHIGEVLLGEKIQAIEQKNRGLGAARHERGKRPRVC
jgi:hypothetical protein